MTEINYPLDSFVFYRSFLDAIEEMTDENKLVTLLAICNYALYGVEPVLKDAMSRAVFAVVRPNIDANKSRRSNGKKGGRPHKKPAVSDPENHRFSKSESNEDEDENEDETVAEASEAADKPPLRRFVPPTVEEVRAYCQKRGNGIDPEAFVDFYTARGWAIGRGKMKDWQAAVRTWEKRRAADSGVLSPRPRRTGHLTVDENGEEVVKFD